VEALLGPEDEDEDKDERRLRATAGALLVAEAVQATVSLDDHIKALIRAFSGGR